MTMDIKFYLFVFSFLIFKVSSISLGSEPKVYSAFDFEEKLLEKVVVLQQSVNNMEKQFEKKMDDLAEMTLKLKDYKRTMESSLTKLQSELQQEQELRLKLESKQLAETKLKMETEHADKMTEMDEAIKRGNVIINNRSMEMMSLINASLENMDKEQPMKPAIAFLAHRVVSDQIGPNADIVFKTPVINTHDVYNPNTGEFIAPIKGTYLFSVHLCGELSKILTFEININGVIHASSRNDKSNPRQCGSVSTVSLLSPGDRVVVRTGGSTESGDVIYNVSESLPSFMGVLV